MRLRIEHTTTFSYDEVISEAYTELRLCPLDTDQQRCLSFAMRTGPGDQHIVQYRDRFGNDVRYVDVIQPHDRLVVSATSEVDTHAAFRDERVQLAPLEQFDFLAPTSYAPFDAALAALSGSGDGAARDESVADVALNLMRATHRSMSYVKGATDVQTTAEIALALGCGVCQDFAHVMLSACRLRGIVSRYVSGYLHAPNVEGGDDSQNATHAWVDVLVPGHGWISLDPTHNCEQTEHYVRVAIGRDYGDVPPTHGMYRGGAKETLDARVSVRAI